MNQQPSIEVAAVNMSTPEIANALEDLHGKSFEKGWSAEAFEKFLNSPLVDTFLARDKTDARVLAFVLFRRASEEAEILSIAVHPNFRKAGIARSICTAGLSELKLKGIREIYLEVSQSNTPAIQLYNSLGFIKIGLRKSYYSDRESAQFSDAVSMRLNI